MIIGRAVGYQPVLQPALSRDAAAGAASAMGRLGAGTYVPQAIQLQFFGFIRLVLMLPLSSCRVPMFGSSTRYREGAGEGQCMSATGRVAVCEGVSVTNAEDAALHAALCTQGYRILAAGKGRCRTFVVCVELMWGHWHGGAAGLSFRRFLFAAAAVILPLLGGAILVGFDAASRRDRRGDPELPGSRMRAGSRRGNQESSGSSLSLRVLGSEPSSLPRSSSASDPSSADSADSNSSSSATMALVPTDAPLRARPLDRRATGCAALPLPFAGGGAVPTAIAGTAADRRLAIVGLGTNSVVCTDLRRVARDCVAVAASSLTSASESRLSSTSISVYPL